MCFDFVKIKLVLSCSACTIAAPCAFANQRSGPLLFHRDRLILHAVCPRLASPARQAVAGNNTLSPNRTLPALGLAPAILQAICRNRFPSTPTPIQAQAIPLVAEGAGDLLAAAQTGTGKTAGFTPADPASLSSNPKIPNPGNVWDPDADARTGGQVEKSVQTTASASAAEIDGDVRRRQHQPPDQNSCVACRYPGR